MIGPLTLPAQDRARSLKRVIPAVPSVVGEIDDMILSVGLRVVVEAKLPFFLPLIQARNLRLFIPKTHPPASPQFLGPFTGF